jgi:hypothetical protein
MVILLVTNKIMGFLWKHGHDLKKLGELYNILQYIDNIWLINI